MDQRGAAAVEFAIIGPVLLLLMAGLIDYGFYVAQSMRLGNVVQGVLQYGAQTDAPQDYLRARLLDKLSAAGVEEAQVDVQRLSGCPAGITLVDGRCPGYGSPQTHLVVSASAPFDARFLPHLELTERRMSTRLR